MRKPIVKDFTSASEFAAYVSDVPAGNRSRESSEFLNEWSGGSFDEAVAFARNGNPEYVSQLFEGVELMQRDVENAASEYRRDVEGQFFDVADVMSGEPESWWHEERTSDRKLVRIWVSFVQGNKTKVAEIINRGAAIVSLCDELQKAGSIVEIKLSWTSHYRGRTYRIDITPDNTPLDIDALAYLMANPTANRRLALAFLEKETKEAHCRDSYGTLAAEGYDGGEDFIFPPIALSNRSWSSIEAAKRNITEAIERRKLQPESPVTI